MKTNEVRLIDANALFDKLKKLFKQEAVGNTFSDLRYGILLAMHETKQMKTVSLNTLRDAIYEDAVAHGLWERTDYNVQLVLQSIRRDDRTTAYRDKIMRELAMRVISLEVDELEGSVEYEEDYAEELADVIIASLSVAGKLGIDIDEAVRRKMEINKGRPWKHGKENEGEE